MQISCAEVVAMHFIVEGATAAKVVQPRIAYGTIL